MNNEIQWAITIIIIMTTITYLYQDVPACVEDTPQVTVITNYSESEVTEINEQIQSDLIIFKTSGNSMEPLIQDNQKCACIKSSTYSVGDIVVYFANYGNGFQGIAHQIIDITGLNITVKGLNNDFIDGVIHEENILCEIPKVKRYTLING